MLSPRKMKILKCLLVLTLLIALVPLHSLATENTDDSIDEQTASQEKTLQQIFPDETLRAAVLKELQATDATITADMPLTETQLASVTSLNIDNQTISSLEGIEQLPQLTSLSANNCGLQDISAIWSAPALKEVSVRDNHIVNLNGATSAQIDQLTTFDASGQTITKSQSVAASRAEYNNTLETGVNGTSVSTENISGQGAQASNQITWPLAEQPDALSYDFYDTTYHSSAKQYSGTVAIQMSYTGKVSADESGNLKAESITADAGMTYPVGATLSSSQFLSDVHCSEASNPNVITNVSSVDTSKTGTADVTITEKDSSGNVVAQTTSKVTIVEPVTLEGFGYTDFFKVYDDTYHQKIKVETLNSGSVIHAYFPDGYYTFTLYGSDGSTVKKQVVVSGTHHSSEYASALNDWSYEYGDIYVIEGPEASVRLVNENNATMQNKPPYPTETNMAGPSLLYSGGKALKMSFNKDGFIYMDNVAPAVTTDASIELPYGVMMTDEEFCAAVHASGTDNMFDPDTMSQDDFFTFESDFDPSIVMNKNGKQTVKVKAIDPSGNVSSTVNVNVTVKEQTVTADEGMTYRTGSPISSESYLNAIHASEISGLTATANLSSVNVNQVGTYTVPIQYKNSNNQVVYEITRKLSIVEPIHLDGVTITGAPELTRYYAYADTYHQKIKIEEGPADYANFNSSYGNADYVRLSLCDKDGKVKNSVTMKANVQPSDYYDSIKDWSYEIGDYYLIDYAEAWRITNEENATIANKPPAPTSTNMVGPSTYFKNTVNDGALKLEMVDTGFKYVDNVPPAATLDSSATLEYKQTLSEADYYDLIHLSCTDNMFDASTMSADDYFTITSDYDPSVTSNRSGTYPITIHVKDKAGNTMMNWSPDTEKTVTNKITMKTTLPTADAVTPNKVYPLGTDISALDASQFVKNLNSTVSFVDDVHVVGWDAANTPSSKTVGTQSGNVIIEDDRGVQASIPVSVTIEYGDSLYVGAEQNRGGVVLTLTNDNGTPELAITAGDNDGSNAFVSSNSSTQFLSTTFYHTNDAGSIGSASQYGSVAVNNGNKLADYTAAYKSAGIADKLQYGDIIAVDYSYQDHVTRYDDSKANTDATSGGTLYYKVTKDGFQLVSDPFGSVQFDQTNGPDPITFNTTKVNSGLKTVNRETDTYDFSIIDTRYQKGWKVYVGIDAPLTSPSGDKLDGAIIWKSADGTETPLIPGSSIEVGKLASTTSDDKETTTLSFGKNEGPLLQYNTNAVKANTYQTNFNWSIVDAP
ncbi:LapB repeat-containing protein [Listeria costaricensis]|uniref:LapB repeat-containing protein n=1 Tax=Listeria costaricensis TaxID=2026604 RepID=UPI000C0746FD|nr:LapB repeat-containing protein [Listeria costaricensis]